MDTSNVFQQMAGGIDKAVLFIRKNRKDEGGKQNVGNNLNAVADIANLRNNAVNNATGALNNSLKSNYHAFYVQYNPSSIRLNNIAGKNSVTRGAGEGGNKVILDMDYPPQTIFDVELIFQDVNPMDAFGKNGFEKVVNAKNNLSVSGIYQAAKAMKSKYSVQDQVEALLSVLMDVDTSKVIFHWAEFEFEGIVNRVDVTYTMFSNAGRPIAAKVSMSMKNTDSSEMDANAQGGEENPNDKYWNEAFKKLFDNETLAGKREDGGWFDSIGNW